MIDREDLLNNFEYWIAYSSRVLEKAANELLTEHGITFRQVKVLACLIVRGPLAQNELADRIQVEPSTIVRLVDRMERDGWVTRASDPTDRRRNIVTLTDMVDGIGDKVLDCAKQIRARAFQGIDEDRIATTVQTLHEICNNLTADTPALTRSQSQELSS